MKTDKPYAPPETKDPSPILNAIADGVNVLFGIGLFFGCCCLVSWGVSKGLFTISIPRNLFPG